MGKKRRKQKSIDWFHETIARTVWKFRQIPEVLDVRAVDRVPGVAAVIAVVVKMPKFDPELMNRLVGLELEMDELAGEHDVWLEYTYIPEIKDGDRFERERRLGPAVSRATLAANEEDAEWDRRIDTWLAAGGDPDAEI